MKKLISLMTSMTLTLCVISVFLPLSVPISTSAESSPPLVEGYMGSTTFDGITVELEGDAIVFKGEVSEVIATAQKTISLSMTNDSCIFRPLGDGKYVISLINYPPFSQPTDDLIFFPPVNSFTFEISITDNVVNIDGMHRAIDKYGYTHDPYGDHFYMEPTYIESFLSDGTTFTSYSIDGTIFCVFTLAVCLSNSIAPVFTYHISNNGNEPFFDNESLITSYDTNAEAFYINGSNIKKITANNTKLLDLFPDIGTRSLPANVFKISSLFSSNSGHIKILLNEGKRSRIFEMDHKNSLPLPETLIVTECPENDINADGSFNVADVLLLQKYLLGKDDISILNWRAADLSNDGSLDIFDLVLLKKALIAS